MGEMASLWGYEEHNDTKQLGQKLLLITLELENLKAETRDEMMKNNEYVKQLIQLLKLAIYERDEARIQLQNLLTKTTPNEHLPIFPLIQADNSNITESGSFSSPLFDGVSSPEFSNMKTVENYALVQDSHAHSSKIDEGELVIDNIAKGRVLPQKGNFLQSVLGAGPLLQTLLYAAPLPRWRNPPQLQHFQVPPVSISESFTQKPTSRFSNPPMLNFGNLASGTCLSHGSLEKCGISSNGYVPLVKRQRFC